MSEIIQDMHEHTPIHFYSDALEKPMLTKCSECGETLDVSAVLLEGQFGQQPDISIEMNTCPTHGDVDRDHRCPAFDGVLRDAWTGEVVLDESYPDRTHLGDGPADNVKYLGMTENGTQYTINSDTQE